MLQAQLMRAIVGKSLVFNHDSKNSISFKKGDRIAQLVIQQVEKAEFIEVEELPGSGRGSGGFGSTGVA